ncbi:MAG: hypothetical protein AB1791_07115 [Chloroflexota bacterium]
MITTKEREIWAAVQEHLTAVYGPPEQWPAQNPAWPLPTGLARGSDPHLAYLTLVYAMSGGRKPRPLWKAAQQTWTADPQLFDPFYLAHAQPFALLPRLTLYGLLQKPKTEATVWQRIGQALVMRAQGSVQQLLADYDYQAGRLLAMLTQSKATFPVLSGPQTAPRWLYGLVSVGGQPIEGAAELPVPVSPAVARVLHSFSIAAEVVPAGLFDVLAELDTDGRD